MTQAEMLAILLGFLDAGRKMEISIDQSAPPAKTGFHIRPTDQVSVAMLTPGGVLGSTARWKFVPHWFRGDVKDYKANTINARIETAAQKPTYRDAWKSARCVIPALGFYEWKTVGGAKRPYFLTVESNAPIIFFAGLYSRRPEGGLTCTILIRDAAPEIAQIHSRMPVVLTSQEIGRWLSRADDDAEVIDHLGTHWTSRWRFHQVPPIRNDSEGPQMIEPVEGGD